MKRAFDPITQTALILVAAFGVALLSFKYSRIPLWISGVLFAIFIYRLYQIKSNPQKYPGKVFNESESSASCLFSEDGTLMSVSPGFSAEADGVKTSHYTDRVYKLRNGTNVRILPGGNVKAYSPFSEWVNPGWKDKAYFEDRGVWDQWESLFKCN